MDDSTIHHYISAIDERLRRIEAQLELLSEKAGIPFVAPASVIPPEVVELARANKRIEAIKRYRELTDATLDEA